MYYDRPLKCYAFLIFNDLKENQVNIVNDFMAKTPVKHLDWPGNSFLETVEYFRESRGYKSSLPKDKRYIIPMETITRVVQDHLRKKLNHHVVLVSDKTMMPKLNRTITNDQDLITLFDSFLSCCDLISLSAALELDKNSSGFYSFTKPVNFDLTLLTEHVITIGNSSEFMHDVSAKGALKEVLNSLFNV